MIDITTRKCEATPRGGYGSCHTNAKAVFAESYYDYSSKVNVPTVTLACGVHAAGLRRRSWAPEELDQFSDTVQRMLADRDELRAVSDARKDAVNAEKHAIAEEQRLERALEAWDAVDVDWTNTLTVEVSPNPWDRAHDRVEVTVHVHAVGTEINGWDRCEVSIDESPDRPAVVKISGGSPMTITTKATSALSSAIAIVSQFVDEINSTEENA